MDNSNKYIHVHTHFQGILCKTLVQKEESALDMNMAHFFEDAYTSTNKLIPHHLPLFFISEAPKDHHSVQSAWL